MVDERRQPSREDATEIEGGSNPELGLHASFFRRGPSSVTASRVPWRTKLRGAVGANKTEAARAVVAT